MPAPNLPAHPTPFIGRAKELAEIATLLANPDCHLLTLVGPGGIGKTRLALNTAREHQSAFSDGVYFVALQPLSSPDFIISAIAEAITFQFYTGGEPEQQLLDYLGDKSLLLVLDNFEHLLADVSIVNDILTTAPSVKLLVTSRERLNLIEEWVLDVQGLPVPNSEAEREITHYGAVQLFLQNAQRAQVGFALGDSQKPAVTRICRLVGGMPLGIELAAAWVRALSCEEIANEIERSMDILATPARNIPPRHRNMRAALEHSWNLLTEEERDVFKRLSVFRGGFRKEAAQYVAGATLQTLSALVDKSLLRMAANGRYELHELLRQYAEEKLALSPPEREQTLDLHSAYYAEFMARQKDGLLGNRVATTLREIEDEIDNVRKAWERAITQHNPIEAEKYLWCLLLFYDTQGWLVEGEEAFERAAQAFEKAVDDPERNRTLGQMYARQAWFSTRLGYYEKAEALLLTSLAWLRPLEAQHEMAFSLVVFGSTCIYRGKYSEAERILQDAEAIYRACGETFELAWALDNEAKLLLVRGDYEQATLVMQETITLCRAHGLQIWLVEALTQFGQIMEALANYTQAEQAYLEAVTLSQDLPPFSAMLAVNFLGRIAYAIDKNEEAAFYYHKALDISKQVGSFRFKLDVLLGMVELQVRQGGIERTIELLALIVQHPASLNHTRDRAQALLQKLEPELPPDVFAARQEKGKAAKLDDALESLYATPLFSHLRSADTNVSEAPKPHPHSSSELDSLTEREIEILRLIAQGMSNREIAETLILAVGTVKWYGSQICGKLHVQNRVQAIARARELNIIL
ncbi:MAG: hypothetical protein H7175_01690 [Burkholderiales bacterium]|nr:hypothetical protein [Anaerolineae bacterium]